MDQERLRNDVCELARPEGRRVGTAGHDHARTWIVSRMENYGLTPYRGESFELLYGSGGIDFVNLAGVVESGHPERTPLLIGAHYDSAIDGHSADDNATAVVAALSAGLHLFDKRDQLDRDVVIAIFDAEEPPYFQSESMGSNWFYRHQMDGRGVHAAIVMDLIAHKVEIPDGLLPLGRLGNAALASMIKNMFFVTGAESSPELSGFLGDMGQPKGLRTLYALNKYVGDMSDHGIFRKNGVPYLFLSSGRWPHYHGSGDTPENVDYAKMKCVLDYLIQLATIMANTQLSRGDEEKDHSIELECRSVKDALPLPLMMYLKTKGVKRLETRSDMDRLANILLGLGL